MNQLKILFARAWVILFHVILFEGNICSSLKQNLSNRKHSRYIKTLNIVYVVHFLAKNQTLKVMITFGSSYSIFDGKMNLQNFLESIH